MKTSKSKSALDARILEEASDWFVEFSEGSVGPSGREEFNAWLRRSPEHIQAYLQIAAFWEDAPLLEKKRTGDCDELVVRALAETNIVSFDPAKGQSSAPPGQLAGVSPASQDRADLLSTDTHPAAPAARWHRLLRPAAATVLLLGLGSAAAWLYNQRDTYTTAVGEQRSIALSDGSTIELNSCSRMRVRFTDKERAIDLLEGQALFHVAGSPSRPFVVHSNSASVRAVGTQFDVYRKSTGTVVTVLEGRVAVANSGAASETPRAPEPANSKGSAAAHAGLKRSRSESQAAASSAAGIVAAQSAAPQEILLAANEQVTVRNTGSVTPVQTADIASTTAWTQRKIAFRRTLLSEVAEEFNRYNARHLVIADATLADTRISGVFSSSDPDSLVRFLRELPGFNVAETSDEIRITRK